MGSAEMSSGGGLEAPLSIALVTPGWPVREFANGIVTSVATLSGGLRGRGHRVHILAQKLVGPEEPGVRAIRATEPREQGLIGRISDRIAYRVSPRRALARSVGRAVADRVAEVAREPGGVDIVEMEETFGWPRDVARFCPVPLVVRLHGPWFLNGLAMGAAEDDAYRQRLRDEGRAIAAADAVTAPSVDVLEQTRAFYKLALPDAEVIPHPTRVPPPDLRWRADACDPGLILFIGRFDRHKGGDTAINAFHRLLALAPEARFCFVGPDVGYVDEAGRTWSLPDYVRERAPGLQESGRFEYRGRLGPDAIADLRRRAAVTLIASRYETLCIAALEAQGHGSPLVATRAGAIPEIVRDGVDGLLCPPGDADAMAAALLRVLRDRDLAAALGRSGADHMEREHSPDNSARLTADFYRRVLDRRRGGR